MSRNIRKHRLLVISDTAMYNEGGILIGFEPVVRELESIAHLFDDIVWLGCTINEKNTPLRVPNDAKIKMVQMPSVNRKGIINAFAILLNYPVFLYYILKYYGKATHIHTRAPAHPAMLGTLLSYIDRKRIYWHKYAGNWKEESLPATYRIQRSLLTKAEFKNIRVTVNGKWDDAPSQIYAFENPCLHKAELAQAKSDASEKDFSGKLKMIFVGNLSAHKGIPELIQAIEDNHIPDRIEEIRIVGGGPLHEELKQRMANITGVRISVLGHLNRKDINPHYRDCHVMILPSKTEGFPKVVAEAAAYGCIPVVTDVSAISQYVVHGKVGYLMKEKSAEEISNALSLLAKNEELKDMSVLATNMVGSFTYEHFVARISGEIFNDIH